MSKQNTKQSKKDKDPPGILDWIVDFFVSPIANAVKGIIAPIFGHPTEEEKVPLKNAVEAIRSAMLARSSPITVDTAQKELEDWAVRGFNNATAAWIEAMVVEAASLGQIDISPSGYLSLPQVRGYYDLCAEIGKAEWQIGKMPFLSRYWLKTYTPLVPEPYRLASMVAKGIISWDVFYAAMAENGLSKGWAWHWGEEQITYPPPDVCNQLLWRGAIDDNTWWTWLARQNLAVPAREALKSLREVIPPLGDLIHFAVREAFGDHASEKQYAEYESWATKMGLTKYMASCYWYAHWLRMGLGEAYRNVYWGYWTKDQFMKHLHISDIHPDDREAIWRVAYLSPSIRELGYGYDVGVYTEGDIALWRQRGGLSPEDAKKAALAMVAYRTEAEREAVRREHLHLFALGRQDETTFTDNLKRLGTAAPAIPLWIERGRLEAERIKKESAMPEQRIISSSEALRAFELGIRDETWTRDRLSDLLWTDDRIDLAIRRVKFDLEQARIKEETVVPRALTVAQLSDLYVRGKVDDLELFNRLIALDYSEEDALMLVELIVEAAVPEAKLKALSLDEYERLFDYMRVDENALISEYTRAGYSLDDARFKVFLANMERLWPVMRTLYRNGWVTSSELFQWLLSIKMPEDRANVLMMETIKAEQPARTAAEKDLTKAEIIKGVKANVLTVAQGIELLQGIGYDESEAQYLLAINKVVAAGDPEGYWEMRAVVEASKRARGLAYAEVPPELITLERELRKAKQELQSLTEAKAAEETIGEVAVRLAGIESEMRRIISSKKLQ